MLAIKLGGSIPSEHTAVATMPCRRPPYSAVTIVTVDASCRIAHLKRSRTVRSASSIIDHRLPKFDAPLTERLFCNPNAFDAGRESAIDCRLKKNFLYFFNSAAIVDGPADV